MIDFIRTITLEAGNIILRSSRNVIREKKEGGNIVLDADSESEEYILNSIQQAYPNHVILSEETHNQLRDPERQEHLWIIDPLDGTSNAKYKIPLFAISVAYAEKGVVIAGGIFDPNRQELFWAEKGKGAFMNGERIRVGEKKDLRGLMVNIGCPYNKENFGLTYPYGKKLHNNGARIVNFGSAVLECAWVANGKLGAYLEAGLKPWDIAAAQLLLSEAGAVMIDPYQQNKPFSIFDQKAILVGNPEVVQSIQQVMQTPDQPINSNIILEQNSV